MKVTVIASSNIALVKYWGKRDQILNLPQNGSISITLDKLQTTTTVNFDENYKEDLYIINGKRLKQVEEIKIKNYVDYLRKLAGIKLSVKIQSESNFPTAAGLASSASGFAALAVTGSQALKLNLSDRDLSILARRGSGSACRSVFGGFVEWARGKKSDGSDSYAVQIAPPDHWKDLHQLIVLTSITKKPISSTKAMQYTVDTSPLYQGWLDSIETDLKNVRQGILNRDFKLVGETAERNCLKMHALMFSTNPTLVYWNETTLNLIKNIPQWREEGLKCYFTIDAGPNVVILCNKQDVKKIENRISNINNIQQIIICSPGQAPQFSDHHLF